MAYETKVILIALAQLAARENSKKIYNAITEMANADGLVLKPFEEARTAELEE